MTEGGSASQLTEGEVWYKNGLEVPMKFVILTTWNNFYPAVKTKQKNINLTEELFQFYRSLSLEAQAKPKFLP